MGAIRRGVKNAFRNTTRTVGIVLVLAAAFALAISMFVANQAAGERVKTATSSLGTTIEVTPAGSFGGFGLTGNTFSSAQVTKIADTKNVTSIVAMATQRLSGAGSSSSTGGFGNFTDGTTSLKSAQTLGSLGRRTFGGGSGYGGYGGYTPPNANSPAPITVVGSTDALDATALRSTSVTLTAGSEIPGSSSADVADVGSTLATKNALKVGSTFTAYGAKITVDGIFDADGPDANSEFVVPLATLERLSGTSGATEVDATANTLGNVSTVAAAIQSSLGASNANVITSQTNSSQVASDLSSIKSVSLFSLVGAIVAAIAILLLSLLLIVRERRREIGILKAFGSSNGGVVTSYAAEAVTLTAMAGVVGVVFGIILSNPVLDALKPGTTTPQGGFFRNGGSGFTPPSGGFHFTGSNFFGTGGLSNLHAVFGGSVIAYCLLAIFGVAIIGSIVPAFISAKVRPAEALRSDA